MHTLSETSTSPTHSTGSTRRDWQSHTLIAGGLLFALGNALHPLEHNDAAYDAPTWKAAHLLMLVSLPLLVLGLPVLYQRMSSVISRRLAVLSVVVTTIGLIGLAPGALIEAFVAPEVGHEAMEAMESGGMGAVNGIFGALFLGGSLALGWAVHRSRLRPRWTGIAMLVASVALVASMSGTGPVAGGVVIAATIAYGLTLAAMGSRA